MIRQRALEPFELLDTGSTQRNFGSGLRVAAGVALTQGQLVVPTGTNKAHVKVGLADADAAATAFGPIWVAEHGAAAGAIARVGERWMLTAQDTSSANAIGDPVYVSGTAGGWSLTPGTYARQVGVVMEVHATTGRVLLTPNAYSATADAPTRIAVGTILAGSVATLNATPVEVIPAPGAGLYIEVVRCHWFLDYGTADYDAAAGGDTLNLKYTDGSGAAVVDAVAGDAIGAASADYHTLVNAVAEVIPVANAPIVAHIASGEWYSSGGDSPLKYAIEYRVRTLAFA